MVFIYNVNVFYLKLRNKLRAEYFAIDKVFCPLIKDYVYFRSLGFHHLQYTSNRKPRTISEQYLKFSYFKYATRVIKYADYIDKITSINTNNAKSLVDVALVKDFNNNISVRVIIRKVGKGNYNFLSVMPHSGKKHKKLKKRHK